jgi:LysR family carnitine catabolism transcriptional activator
MKFSLRQLEGFTAAARLGSFTAAARKVSMTQPAFSQMIRELENIVGMKLFERTTRKIELTEIGRQLLSMIERPLNDLDQAYADVRNLSSGIRGRIVIGVLPSFAFSELGHSLAKFRAAHPGVVVNLVEAANPKLIESVLSREVDFGIGMMSAPRERLVFHPLLQDELVAIFPKDHVLARRKHVSWLELAKQPLILLVEQSSSREVIDRGFAVHGVTAQPAYEIENMVTSLTLVRAGLGITIFPNMALPALNMQGLQVGHIAGPRPTRTIGVLSRVGASLPPAATNYVQSLIALPRRKRAQMRALAQRQT